MPDEYGLLIPLSMAAIAGVAAVFDWRSGKIPNALIGTGLVVAFGEGVLLHGLDSVTVALLGLAVGLLVTLPGFTLGFTGAGDVKLLMMLGAFAGPERIFKIFVVTVFIGAGLVLVMAAYRRFIASAAVPTNRHRYRAMLQTLCKNGELHYLPPAASSILGVRFPLAPIVATAVLATVLYTPLGR